jgi:glycosyltransferase involved in cell wall biosynthesis
LKILFISESDFQGGAARAAFRLYKGIQDAGIKCQMLVQNKLSDEDSVIGPETNIKKTLCLIRTPLDHSPKLLYPNRKKTVFHNQWLPGNWIRKISQFKPDIVHLHWICRGFLDLQTIRRIDSPIVWTLHDLWPFTGGCHYPSDCERFRLECGCCPQLRSRRTWDLSHWNWKHKNHCYRRLKISLIAPSRWISKCSASSSLMKQANVRVIPNGIDTEIYKPVSKKYARKILGLPGNAKLILFASSGDISDRRKGLSFLEPSLELCKKLPISDTIQLVSFGGPQKNTSHLFGFPIHWLGKLYDDISIALVYNACDLLLCTSKADNLPNTIMESLACGTPCVSFDVGGINDMIIHQANGYLARAFEINDLVMGIHWTLENPERWQKLSNSARIDTEKKFKLETVSQSHLNFYKQVIEKSA